MAKKCSALRLSLFCLCAGLLLAGPAAAQDSPVNNLLQNAAASFNSGDYPAAAKSLEEVIRQAADSPQLEPVYYMLGSSYFNMSNYDKAIEVFTKYKAKFPKGDRMIPVSFSLGQAYMLTKKPALAATEFSKLSTISPRFREESLLYQAEAMKEQGNAEGAIPLLEKLTAGGIKSGLAAKAGLALAPLYAKKDEGQKAVALLTELQKNMNLVENIVQFNSVAIKLGDTFLGGKMYEEALSCYRMVLLKKEVVKLQTERLEKMQDAVKRNLDAIRADPKTAPNIMPINNRINGDIEQAKSLLDQFQKLPAYAPTLDLRIGRAYYQLGKKWEAIVGYGDVLRKFPQSAEAEPALFGMIVAYVDLERVPDAQKLGSQYLRDFAAGPNADTVAYLMGACSMNLGDYPGAEKVFTRMLAERPKSAFRGEMLYMLGNCKFAQSKFDDAAATFKKYLFEFRKGAHAEDASYHIAAGNLFNGKPDDALRPLQDFVKKYPGGSFTADAKYRIGVCLSAQQKYDEVLALCQAWQKQYVGNPELAEVLALQGDAQAATDKADEAIDSYTRSSKEATNLQTLKYALFDGAVKLLEKRRDWETVSTLLEDFVKRRPDSPLAVTALYEIGKARAHEDKIEEAKTFLAGAAKKFMPDPQRDDVERILDLLDQLCIKTSLKPAADAGASPAPPPPPPDLDPELDRLLGSPSDATAQARILYAKAKLANLQKKPLVEQEHFQSIADKFKPADLSAPILAQIADYLVQMGRLDKAAGYYREIEATHPSSEQIDAARVGLGEIAYQKHDYKTALRQFSDAVDKSTSAAKLKDATLGKGKTLLALNKLNEAKKLFEQVAAVREWRGPATAESVYSLGQIAWKQGKLPEAIAFYQRVYVAYQRYLPWVAKAYLASGVVFEQMKKTPEAIKTYQEMLRNEKLSTFPETEQARQRLQTLGNG